MKNPLHYKTGPRTVGLFFKFVFKLEGIGRNANSRPVLKMDVLILKSLTFLTYVSAKYYSSHLNSVCTHFSQLYRSFETEVYKYFFSSETKKLS